ncbi:MAG: acetyl-CoA carboxylase biotin carboxyl carrier protein [Alphaproteobacteria bacterium]|nr:acetyl-CoA carboxylase biotin carboxyl carrier protein [Alphaproteobacteria bacterium]
MVKIDKNLIRDLARLLDEEKLSEIEIELSGSRVRVVRQEKFQNLAPLPFSGTDPVFSPSSSPREAAASTETTTIPSPIVGTAYRSPGPDAKPFVEVGSNVKEGASLLIIEAMKTMNHIQAPRDGKIKAILFEDGQPVEFGEPLLVIE